MAKKNIPQNLLPIVNKLKDYVAHFDELIKDVPPEETSDLRNKPEILSKIKSFYSLCFYAMAQDLNNKLSDITGVETKLFSETFKASGVEFHYDRLGKLTEEATDYIGLVVRMGVLQDVAATIAMPDLTQKADLLIAEDRNDDFELSEEYPRVLNFLFPRIEQYGYSLGFPESGMYGYTTLLDYFRSDLYRVIYNEDEPFKNDFASSLLSFMYWFSVNTNDFSEGLNAIPMLNQDTYAERMSDSAPQNQKLIPELIVAIYSMLVSKELDNNSGSMNNYRLKDQIDDLLFPVDNRVVLIPTMKWAEPNLVDEEDAYDLSDSALPSGQVFEAICVHFEQAELSFYRIDLKIIRGDENYARFIFSGERYRKFSGGSKIYPLRLFNNNFLASYW